MKKVIVALLLAVVVSLPSFTAYAAPESEIEQTQESEKADIIKICKWVVSTVPSDDNEQTEKSLVATTKLLKFAAETPNITFDISEKATKLIDLSGKNDISTDLFGVYLAGEILYCLENNLNHSDAQSFAAAMENVMNIYAQMSEHPVKSLNKYLKMSKEKRMSAFVKLYNK